MRDQIAVRRQRLLAEIRRVGGRYTTGQAHAFYRATGYGPCRTTARTDRGRERPRLLDRLVTARRTVWWACHWTATTLTAAVASLAAALPFEGPYASASGIVADTAVCLIGLATAPHPNGAPR